MSTTIPSRNEWIFGRIKNCLNDKEYMLQNTILQMLNRTTRMFKYDNIPKTIQVKDLETQLQVGGFAVWKKVNGELYTFTAGLGGEPNPYYLPTLAIVANPALRYNESLKIDKDCVVMLNDNFYQGLMPMFNKYAGMLTEAEISLKYAIINARVPALIQADNDSTYESAMKFFDKVVEGKEYGIISSKEFFDGIRAQDYYKQAYIKDVIESIQYIKGSWFNEIGLKAAYNMKREAINESEADLNDDILHPTIDTMLDCRKTALEKVNEMYGTNITVELDSAWGKHRERDDLADEYKEAEIESMKKENIEEMEDKENENFGDTDRQ